MCLEYLNHYAPLIQGGSTVILAGLTFFYVWHTRSMARTMENELEITHRGYLGIDSIIEPGNHQGQWYAVLKNYGQAPIILKRKSCVLDNETKFDKNDGTIIYPGQELPLSLCPKDSSTMRMITVKLHYETLGINHHLEQVFKEESGLINIESANYS